MTDEKAYTELGRLLQTWDLEAGYNQTVLPGVRLLCAKENLARCPVSYDPAIFIVGRGRKTCWLGGEEFYYDTRNYLIVAVPLPFECAVNASPEDPFLGMSVKVDPMAIGELLLEMGETDAFSGPTPQAIHAASQTPEMENAAARLLKCLKQPQEARVLGPGLVKEITYRALCGEQGQVLRAVASQHGNFGRIARVLHRMHQDYDQAVNVETLAEEAHMSASTFHQFFKEVTSSSPLQYLKSIRLHKARMLMLHEGCNAGDAAERVGYVSPSQFSREFKRFFGASPSHEISRHRGVAV